MKWRKLGLIFCANDNNDAMISGGRAPVPLHIHGDYYRIYFASYDLNGRGSIFSLEIDINDPLSIKKLSKKPILTPGNVGFFDDNGIIPSDLVREGDKIRLYTIGFSLKNKIIFDAASGLAVSSDGGLSFTKLNGPVLDRGVDDPCFAASPTVMKDDDRWRMWFVSCDRWELIEGKYRHFYNIKHKFSDDGIYWESKSTTCIDYANEFEYAISRPCVIKCKDGIYRMWYSFRAQENVSTYRIGFASSSDGLNWNRTDHLAGINVSDAGWDSEMICYPYVFKHREQLYMLYNGNGYGKTGFGLAVLERN